MPTTAIRGRAYHESRTCSSRAFLCWKRSLSRVTSARSFSWSSKVFCSALATCTSKWHYLAQTHHCIHLRTQSCMQSPAACITRGRIEDAWYYVP